MKNCLFLFKTLYGIGGWYGAQNNQIQFTVKLFKEKKASLVSLLLRIV